MRADRLGWSGLGARGSARLAPRYFLRCLPRRRQCGMYTICVSQYIRNIIPWLLHLLYKYSKCRSFFKNIIKFTVFNELQKRCHYAFCFTFNSIKELSFLFILVFTLFTMMLSQVFFCVPFLCSKGYLIFNRVTFYFRYLSLQSSILDNIISFVADYLLFKIDSLFIFINSNRRIIDCVTLKGDWL